MKMSSFDFLAVETSSSYQLKNIFSFCHFFPNFYLHERALLSSRLWKKKLNCAGNLNNMDNIGQYWTSWTIVLDNIKLGYTCLIRLVMPLQLAHFPTQDILIIEMIFWAKAPLFPHWKIHDCSRNTQLGKVSIKHEDTFSIEFNPSIFLIAIIAFLSSVAFIAR